VPCSNKYCRVANPTSVPISQPDFPPQENTEDTTPSDKSVYYEAVVFQQFDGVSDDRPPKENRISPQRSLTTMSKQAVDKVKELTANIPNIKIRRSLNRATTYPDQMDVDSHLTAESFNYLGDNAPSSPLQLTEVNVKYLTTMVPTDHTMTPYKSVESFDSMMANLPGNKPAMKKTTKPGWVPDDGTQSAKAVIIFLENDSKSQKSPKDKTLDDLKKFSETFKLNSPVPSDLVSILANDPAKQKEIKDKALKNAKEATRSDPIQEMKDKASKNAAEAPRSYPGQEINGTIIISREFVIKLGGVKPAQAKDSKHNLKQLNENPKLTIPALLDTVETTKEGNTQ
jgi:hypothetical protein